MLRDNNWDWCECHLISIWAGVGTTSYIGLVLTISESWVVASREGRGKRPPSHGGAKVPFLDAEYVQFGG